MLCDSVSFAAFTTALTAGLAHYPTLIWPLLLWAIHHRWQLTKTSIDKRPALEERWINWFEITKFLGAIAGLGGICLFHSRREFSHHSLTILGTILQLNILIAVVSGIQKGDFCNYLNSFAGLILVGMVFLEYDIPAEYFDQLKHYAEQTGLCMFPLTWRYIVLYTSWNAAFTYSANFSNSTRLILVAPCVFAYLSTTESWLGARCFSLTLNMILRATECGDFYTPGKTAITAVPLAFVHSPSVLCGWVLVNFCLAIGCMFSYLS